ncbi:Rna polymerase ii c-terminal domain phosphatase-like [Thalictrum thalictroides]|uniref:protein-serine/threonine phosphatase n=1 Tax=Thalictrum thalictroides TaxID=46969 RepID=A0A7J6VYR8_THATH|nr:Rna polymerase ii c-terminal domain phosphatase-like [Thalictrum thalictroides]
MQNQPKVGKMEMVLLLPNFKVTGMIPIQLRQDVDFQLLGAPCISLVCHKGFSGLFGLHEANPQKYDLWQLAEQFGAVCTTKMYREVTHVVAFIGKTYKVKMALDEGKYVVSHRWIEASSLLYRKEKETDYPFDFVTKDLFHPKLK